MKRGRAQIKYKKSNKLTKYRIIFQTGKSYEILLASNKLKEAKIPFITRQESVSGISLAMPPSPIMGPGIYFSIRVPEPIFDDAIEVLKELPIDLGKKPDVWDFGPSEDLKMWWKFYAKVILIGTFITFFIFLLWLILDGFKK